MTIAKTAKSEFFTPVIAHEICYKLINEYFILTEKDLTAWDADPEAYGLCTVVIVFFLFRDLHGYGFSDIFFAILAQFFVRFFQISSSILSFF